VVDSIGSWIALGTVRPILDNWVDFPDVSIQPNPIFRIKFLVEEQSFKGFVLLRSKYLLGDYTYKSTAILIYPDDDYQIFQLPVPQSLVDLGVNERTVQVRPRWYTYLTPGLYPPVPIRVLLEELF
jgi:hypothetical protein